MAEPLANDAHYWAARALQARGIAELMPDDATRSRILRIARHYELIAEQAVHLLKSRAVDRTRVPRQSRHRTAVASAPAQGWRP
jgi:hypothetical protein